MHTSPSPSPYPHCTQKASNSHLLIRLTTLATASSRTTLIPSHHHLPPARPNPPQHPSSPRLSARLTALTSDDTTSACPYKRRIDYIPLIALSKS